MTCLPVALGQIASEPLLFLRVSHITTTNCVALHATFDYVYYYASKYSSSVPCTSKSCQVSDLTLTPGDNAAEMSQVWSGNISTDDPATRIEGTARILIRLYARSSHADIQIWSNPSTPISIPENAKLHFLSLVEIARIPLYLAAGPSCDVSTGNETTITWLTEALLTDEGSDHHEEAPREPRWMRTGGQSENGILLRVETENEEELGIRNVVTELLVYAAIAKSRPALPTPPMSSSLAPSDGDPKDALLRNGNTVKVFALPLCSHVIGSLEKLMDTYPPNPSESQSAPDACFLPYTHDPAQVTQQASQKRQSISKLFEDATKKRRKFKGGGGESVSQAMAGIDRLPSQHDLWEKQEALQPQNKDPRRESLSRVFNSTPAAGSEHARPISRSAPLAHGKPSSLHQVESVISARDSPTLSDRDCSYAQQNKAALTKVVMAAMRLHGLQQKKKPPSHSQLPNSVASHTETNVISNEADEEYKLVYHQTFKAAMFTFRKHLNGLLISQETMREVVDQLLTMFCTDPMNLDGVSEGGESREFEASKGGPSSSPFDKPSSQAQVSSMGNVWNRPTVKKR